MNVSSPKAYTISDVDSMPADRTTPMELTPLPLAPVGGKAVALDFYWGPTVFRCRCRPAQRHR